MWSLYIQAKTWSTRPSHILGIMDSYVAYCIDEAVALFGNTIADELSEIEDKNPKKAAQKQERYLHQRLGIPLKFRDPAKLM